LGWGYEIALDLSTELIDNAVPHKNLKQLKGKLFHSSTSYAHLNYSEYFSLEFTPIAIFEGIL
jgi:hypothetical protein